MALVHSTEIKQALRAAGWRPTKLTKHVQQKDFTTFIKRVNGVWVATRVSGEYGWDAVYVYAQPTRASYESLPDDVEASLQTPRTSQRGRLAP